MPLTNREMARLGELLDEAMPLTLEQRQAWLDTLTGEDQALVRTLRAELLGVESESDGLLDRPPRIDGGDGVDVAASGRRPGERLGPYELLRLLGSGGMADVWLACRTDGAFERQVALKIPRLQSRPVEMTARFALEKNILATLEYPGIARLYDAGVDASGVPYIAMEYVQGEPLVAWCDARGLDRKARIQLFLQVLEVVAYAHGRKVIHRDLKPSNILVTGQGEVRLLDFGIARLLQPEAETDSAVLTRAYGLALTPEYASPELLHGESIDARTDIYSLGVLLHELLTGARPAQTASPADRNRPRLHGALRDVVTQALRPDPGERFPDAASFAAALRRCADGETRFAPAQIKPRHLWVAGVAALVGMAALLAWTLQQRGQERWAREELLPRLQTLIAADDYAAAFDVAREIERVTPRDPVLRDLEPSFSAKVTLDTSPGDAKVFYRPYAAGEKEWRFIGQTPLKDVAVPIGVGLWRIEKQGHDVALLTLRNPGLQLGNAPDADLRLIVKGADLTLPLADAATSPDDMVLVPAIPAVIPGVGGDTVEVPAFFIDRFEVRNREFKEFVDAGGYTEASHWRNLPFDGGAEWRTAAAGFVDLTGGPGPSTWRAGSYPAGLADHPVTGVSWYEAAAYCRFRGKELPTAYHWYRAAGSIVEFWESVASAIVHSSNFAGRELAPVGRFGSVGPHGTYDMAGNAREWLWTQGSLGRWVAGGAFDEPRYLYLQPDEAPPAHRSANTGFRCMRPAQAAPTNEELRRPVLAQAVDYAAMKPVGDAAYAVLAQQLDYRQTPFTPRVEAAGSTNPAWTVERITLPTGYDDMSFAVQLFLPTDRRSPSGVIFYLPHSGEFIAPVTTARFDPAAGGVPLDFLLKSGWALAVVAFDGAYERQWSAEREQSIDPAEGARLRRRHWREDLGRAIDYLTTREDIDARKLGWFGVSMGADTMLPLLAVEKRIGAAVLYSGGASRGSILSASEQPYSYFPRVTQPVLMLNGRWDIDRPPAAQQRLFELLGSPADGKKQVLFEAGHGNLPRFQVEKETLEWFDRRLDNPPTG